MATGNVVPLQRPVDPVEALRKIGEATDDLHYVAEYVANAAGEIYGVAEIGTLMSELSHRTGELAIAVKLFSERVKAAVQGVQ